MTAQHTQHSTRSTAVDTSITVGQIILKPQLQLQLWLVRTWHNAESTLHRNKGPATCRVYFCLHRVRRQLTKYTAAADFSGLNRCQNTLPQPPSNPQTMSLALSYIIFYYRHLVEPSHKSSICVPPPPRFGPQRSRV